EVFAQVLVDGGRERMVPGGERGVEVRRLPRVFPVQATVAGVQSSHRQAFITHQLLPKEAGADAHVVLPNDILAESRVARVAPHERIPSCSRQRSTQRKRRNQLVDREGLHFRQNLVEVARLKVSRQLTVIPGRGRKVGQVERVTHRTFAREPEPGGRYQDHTVQVHPVGPLQPSGQPCHTSGTVALADQVLGRTPAPHTRHEHVQPLGQVGNVFVHSEELITPRISDDSRETRVHRIDVYDIRHVEDGVRIVLHSIGLYGIALIIYAQELWTGVGNVHPYG